MAGDPDTATSLAILKALPKAGADVIELGMPFTDPMADGPAIQAGGLRALNAGQTMKKTLAMVRDFRKGDTTTPLVLMGYYNPIYIYGVEAFFGRHQDGGRRRPDRGRPAARGRRGALLAGAGRWPQFHSAGNADRRRDKRLPAVLTNTSGFVYYVSITGITGAAAPDASKVRAAVIRIKRHTKLPVAVGFGVRTAQQARAIADGADGVVVGSALVTAVKDSLDNKGNATPRTVKSVAKLVSQLADGIRGARRRPG